MPSPEYRQRPGNIWEALPLHITDLNEVRQEMEQIAVSVCRPARGVHWEAGQCGGVAGKWVFPPANNGGVLLYFHGGGFTLGSSGLTLPFLVELAQLLDLTSFSADYRLAPEHPFPAAPEDALQAYRGLLDLGYQGENIVIGGDSTGATLAMSLVHMINAARLPAPRGMIAIAPVSLAEPKKAPYIPDVRPGLTAAMAAYAPEPAWNDYRLDPCAGDLSRFCPTLLIVGGADPGLENALALSSRLIRAGNEVQLLVGRDMRHTYPLDFTDYPEAAEAFAEIVNYIRIKLALDD